VGKDKKRKGEGRENEREWKNDGKGLQCLEFLTWKVGNPSQIVSYNLNKLNKEITKIIVK